MDTFDNYYPEQFDNPGRDFGKFRVWGTLG